MTIPRGRVDRLTSAAPPPDDADHRDAGNRNHYRYRRCDSPRFDLRSLDDVGLGGKGFDGGAELVARALDIRLQLVNAGVATGFSPMSTRLLWCVFSAGHVEHLSVPGCPASHWRRCTAPGGRHLSPGSY